MRAFPFRTRSDKLPTKENRRSPIRLKSGGRLTSALVAVDGSASDEGALWMACSLLNRDQGVIHAVYVIEIERGLPLDAEIAPATAKGEDVLLHAEDFLKPFKVHVEAELLQSRKVGTAIVREALEKQVEAIVMGMTYRERNGRFSLGDTVPYVLENAPCRVFVWRGPLGQDPSSQTPLEQLAKSEEPL